MSGPAWAPREILYFLDLNAKGIPAEGIACGLGNRSKGAVQGMRRKLKRLQELGAAQTELPRLLAVSEGLALSRGLLTIRHRAGLPWVQVRHYLRRGRLTGRPHLVGEHCRRPVGAP